MNAQEKQLLNALHISPSHLNRVFGQKTVTRGLGYYRAGRVYDIKELADGPDDELEIIGNVDGSGAKQYETSVLLYADLGETVVESGCSCPVGLDCKHGIALLFTYLSEVDELEEDPTEAATDHIAEWLDFVQYSEGKEETHFVEKDADPTDYQQHLIYLLDMSTPRHQGEQEGIFVQPTKARLLKKGGYGATYKLHDYDIMPDNPAASKIYCNTLDREIIRTLTGAETSGYYSFRYYDNSLNSEFLLEGDVGRLVLNKLLQTGRCFWKHQKSSPLQSGEPRTVSVHWQDNDGLLIPQRNCTPPIQKAFKLDQLLYVDEVNNLCGPISHETLSDRQLTYLLTIPPIPMESAPAISDRLLQILPEAETFLPEEITGKSVEITGQHPVFHLKLHGINAGADSRIYHVASLSFAYDTIPYSPENNQYLGKDVIFVQKGENRYKIHRHPMEEQRGIDRLLSAGFLTAHNTLPAMKPLDMVIPARSTAESVLKWDDFLQTMLPELEAEGWQITFDESFQLSIDAVDEWHGEISESEEGDWFEMTLGFELNGQSINMLPLVVEFLRSEPDRKDLAQSLAEQEYRLLQLGPHQWVKVPGRRIQQIAETITELYDTVPLNANGALPLSKHGGLHYGELLNDPGLQWKGGEELRALSEKISNFAGIEKTEPPPALQAELRPYQEEGLSWLQFLREYDLSGVLADDMGLGKTIQALTCLLLEKESGRGKLPSLVIAPTSLMSNWRREAERFTPQLKVLTLQGSDRKEKFSRITEHDLILTTYPLMTRDTTVYQEHSFHYLILDEAQAIKNSRTRTSRIIYDLQARHRLCLTGTPMENHLGELWSMFHFLMPGYLGTQERFTRLFRTPIEKHGDPHRGEQLRKRVQPFLLRRTKERVATDLPEKTEIVRTVPLTGRQRDLYESVRVAMDKKVRQVVSDKGLARSHIMILDALLKLRQVCCDPHLVKLERAKGVKESAKLHLLQEMLPTMVEEGRKILLFSQFTSMLTIIEQSLKNEKISYSKLTGRTRKREEAIQAFQEGDAQVFLISLKAGGVGLNLTAADTVIHYDPWWNPAVEKQATDRAHRIGQDKPVFAYKLLTEDTVEEKILKLQEKKQRLADTMYGGKGSKEMTFGQEELLELLQPLG